MVNTDSQPASTAAAPMRDASLFFLYSSISRIKGVGGATSEALRRLLPVSTTMSGTQMPTIRDLLFHLPVGIVDRRFTCDLNTAPDGVIATFVVTVESHLPSPPGIRRGSRRPYKVICGNETGDITLVFFTPQTEYLKNALPVGGKRVISGRCEHFEHQLQMTHPDIITTPDKLSEVMQAEPVYPLTIGLTSRRIAKFVQSALEKLPDLPEWIDAKLLAEKQWPSWKEAMHKAHHPQTPEDLLPTSPARARLAYDEMLATQAYLALVRRNMQAQAGRVIKGTGKLTNALEKSLPFKLTFGQTAVSEEIYADMASGRRMGRLLQGDVGSGKTVVALLASLRAIENGYQSALMVPTELVAQQHYASISRFASPLGVKIALLTGSVKGKARKEVLEGIASGSINLVVGTHALFQEQVTFRNLALVVIDEQHRFGVAQRMALVSKGEHPHLLHMTATPIPRSLTMTLYGDMDCSLLKEKPAGRRPITTRILPLSRYDEVMERLKAALDAGEKIYWVCPMIEEKIVEGELMLTPESDIAAAESRFTEFKARFGDKVGLVHGRIKSDARDEQMQRFARGEIRLLVATTVVEVGVDVKDATIIVIEKAERFGLSQLHQLRGRVGRADLPSSCLLLYSDGISHQSPAPGPSLARLQVLRDSEDGFKIAEADLHIRGGGDLLGSRQSGLPRFIFMHLLEHQEWLAHAREDAAQLLAADPVLQSGRGPALHILLQLFGNEAPMQ